MGDLLTNVVQQYAVHWEELGLKLGLEEYHINNINEDNANRRDRQVETCCTDMLKKWLREIPSPTWGKLDNVIKSLPTVPATLLSTEGKLKH